MKYIQAFIHGTVWALRHVRGKMCVPEIPTILRLLKGRSVFIDIGAHGGSWCMPLSLQMERVFAFEALPHYAASLRVLKYWLGRSNVEIINSAVSDKSGFIDLVWKDSEGRPLTGFTHVAASGESSTQTCRVSAITLDEVLPVRRIEKIDLIKCDVEGAEYAVFSGATATIKRHRPIVYSEVNDTFCQRYGKRAFDTFNLFRILDYEAFLISQQKLTPFYENEREPFSSDLLFIPREQL